jgi:DNA-binding transcriptional ArsR family regulator
VRSFAPKFSPSKVISPPVMAALEGTDVGTGESYVNQAFVPVPTMPETVSAKEMAVALVVSGGTQANVSRHLQTLMDAGMLTRRKEGLQVFYGIGDDSIFQLCELVCGSLEQQHMQRAESLAR